MSVYQSDMGSLTRFFTMFSTFTQKMGSSQRQLYRSWKNGQITFGQFMADYALEMILPPVIMNIALSALWWETPEPEDVIADVLTYQFAGLLGLNALVRSQVEKRFKGKAFPAADSPMLYGFRMLDRGVDAVLGLAFDNNDEKQFEKKVWTVYELISYMTGVPIAKIHGRMTEGLRQYSADEGTLFNVVAPNPDKYRRR